MSWGQPHTNIQYFIMNRMFGPELLSADDNVIALINLFGIDGPSFFKNLWSNNVYDAFVQVKAIPFSQNETQGKRIY